MAKTNGATLLGGKELERMFKTLGGRVQRKVAKQAVNAAATPIAKAAQEKAPEETGALKLALQGGKKVKGYSGSGVTVAVIGPRTNVQTESEGEIRKPFKYAHLAEGGHIAEDGTHVPGQPFMRPAFDENEAKALGVMKDKFAVGVVKEAKKAVTGGGA